MSRAAELAKFIGDGTLGLGGAEDKKLVFNGNAQDFHIGLDDSADSLTIGLGSTLGTTSHMIMDANGHITKPLQSAFLITKSSTQSDLALNTENTIEYDTERFDQNGDFASNTFTAPVTGRYQLNTMNFMGNIDSAATYYSLRIRTSNRDYFGTAYAPSSTDSDPAYWVFSANVLADMDANDTAIVTLYQPNGTAQTDADGSHVCSFSGFLVC
tara:strand:+ start:527 stop:1165 length:639 start_codon:yes stop_codon:yes gene_type:complete